LAVVEVAQLRLALLADQVAAELQYKQEALQRQDKAMLVVLAQPMGQAAAAELLLLEAVLPAILVEQVVQAHQIVLAALR
tara:strand:- start:299 stop:538 length:240 start_codon:yes stop_codon:yes gene_type:complete